MDDLDIRDLTEFRSWSTTFDPPIDDPTFFLSNHLSITSALLLTDLMFPACVLVRGCVIRKEIYDPENFERWWRETGRRHRGDRECPEPPPPVGPARAE